jgi:hypothetical protein
LCRSPALSTRDAGSRQRFSCTIAAIPQPGERLAGVTYFFGIARANGTIDRIIDVVLARIGSNVVVLPFAFFGLTAAISAMGAPVGVFEMAPIGMQHRGPIEVSAVAKREAAHEEQRPALR